MMRSPSRSLVALGLLASLGALTACSTDELSRTFGFTREAPDEFTVTTRAPLSMPPDDTLPPPQPGAPRPQEMTTQQAAEAALAPETALLGASGQDSPGQDALVQQAGPAAPADIRQKVDDEAQRERPSQSFTDRLMFWKSPPPPGAVVDAAAESQRLRQNAALGQSPQAGETPIIQPNKDQGLLGGGLLGNLF